MTDYPVWRNRPGEASEYEFFLDEARRQKLELRREPVMRWIGSGSFTGDVYVWTHEGAAAVIGSVFSREHNKARLIMHEEFHFPSSDESALRRGKGWLQMATPGTGHHVRAAPGCTRTGHEPNPSPHANARPGPAVHLPGRQEEPAIGDAPAAPTALPLRDQGRDLAGHRRGRVHFRVDGRKPTQRCSS